MATDVQKVLDSLGEMTVLELVELKNAIEEQWGVTAAAPVAFAQPGAAPAGDGAAAEEADEEVVDAEVVDGDERK
jgi:large subunit ribosomal protein L7/L12